MSVAAALLALSGALSVFAHFERGQEQKIVFTIRNEGTKTAKLDTFHSPCNPLRVSVVLVKGEGPDSVPIVSVPFMEHFPGDILSLAPGEAHVCAYELSYWFQGKLPSPPTNKAPYAQTQILWSYRPLDGSGYSQELYGGAFSLYP
jgi:hypothetical protein